MRLCRRFNYLVFVASMSFLRIILYFMLHSILKGQEIKSYLFIVSNCCHFFYLFLNT